MRALLVPLLLLLAPLAAAAPSGSVDCSRPDPLGAMSCHVGVDADGDGDDDVGCDIVKVSAITMRFPKCAGSADVGAGRCDIAIDEEGSYRCAGGDGGNGASCDITKVSAITMRFECLGGTDPDRDGDRDATLLANGSREPGAPTYANLTQGGERVCTPGASCIQPLSRCSIAIDEDGSWITCTGDADGDGRSEARATLAEGDLLVTVAGCTLEARAGALPKLSGCLA